jgi:hypothetical protein
MLFPFHCQHARIIPRSVLMYSNALRGLCRGRWSNDAIANSVHLVQLISIAISSLKMGSDVAAYVFLAAKMMNCGPVRHQPSPPKRDAAPRPGADRHPGRLQEYWGHHRTAAPGATEALSGSPWGSAAQTAMGPSAQRLPVIAPTRGFFA